MDSYGCSTEHAELKYPKRRSLIIFIYPPSLSRYTIIILMVCVKNLSKTHGHHKLFKFSVLRFLLTGRSLLEFPTPLSHCYSV